jgi:hypothetical protein
MNVDKEIPASWSELALQDLLIDVAAVVDATGFDRTSNILNGPNGNLGLSGVTSTLADDAHNLVYITNGEGLWILKHQPDQARSSVTRSFSSEDASNDSASCQ